MNLVSYSQAEGAVFRDPVNGETAKLSAETAYHDARKHHRYFFTSQKTRDQFAADPERYLDTDQAQK
jgi:YHS domain-containing protein